eukprot:3827571-Rhodomonas_salina.1
MGTMSRDRNAPSLLFLDATLIESIWKSAIHHMFSAGMQELCLECGGPSYSIVYEYARSVPHRRTGPASLAFHVLVGKQCSCVSLIRCSYLYTRSQSQYRRRTQ